MNANLKQSCGMRKVTGADGARGMSTDDLKKFIQGNAPAIVKEQFSRLQKKDRASMCKLLKTFAAGKKLLGISSPKPSRNGNSNSNSGNNRMSDKGNNSNSDKEVNYGSLRICSVMRA